MKKLAFFVWAIVFATATNAAQPSAESIQLLLTVTKAESLMESIFANMEANLKQAMTGELKGEKHTPQQQKLIDTAPAKIAHLMREEMSWDKLLPLNIQIYQESFTQEEIDGLIAFYQSPAGAAFVNKMPIVMQKSTSVMQSRMIQMLGKVNTLKAQLISEAKAVK